MGSWETIFNESNQTMTHTFSNGYVLNVHHNTGNYSLTRDGEVAETGILNIKVRDYKIFLQGIADR